MQKFYLIPTWEEGRNMLEKVKSVPSLQDEERATKAGMGHSSKWDGVKANSTVAQSLHVGLGRGGAQHSAQMDLRTTVPGRGWDG